MPRRRSRYRPHVPEFRLGDLAQQVVGGFLLSGAFVVTEEVWVLAQNLPPVNSVLVIGIVMLIGYAALYRADSTHDVAQEADVRGIPLRFLSLMIVSFGSVAILAFIFNAPDTFLDSISFTQKIVITAQAVAIGAIFSVIGAATADSVF
jgi:uncharacterized membrane protein